ncbi:MAG: hypothetical protein AABX79_01035 [Nanoarchaeota archaeon]
MEYVFVSGKDFNEARRGIRELKGSGKTIVFSSNDDELARKVLEKEAIGILLINQKNRKDRAKQRDSGFNHVLAKLAKKKDIVIGINLDEVLKAGTEKKEKAEILSRIRQNIAICNKNRLKMSFLPKLKDEYGLKALGLVLGMPTWMTKELQ